MFKEFHIWAFLGPKLRLGCKKKQLFSPNCLTYWYRYWPKFFNWLLVFLEKAQTTSSNQNFIICGCYFSCCYLFVFVLWHSHMSLSCLSSEDGLMFFCFSFCGALGLLLCLKSEKQKGRDSLCSLMGSCHNSYFHTYLSQNFWVNGYVWTRGFIEDDVISGRFININSHYRQPVD